ncbi:efflux RND transporter periplasmic adaptor subunit [Sediminitomix flava]|uniref:RND family efflux transporter MFP subunit n=1 Tax=Sediminitomix flava TaxID=379075 RepID=A0A315ZXA1_SEDFL|nr:efflux RND transporter periplasmic adaptor subunit [Sediminitomix flava]PWJ41967.1 RND family efflux transporter MFP subunit [Sediminitomix flava]
MRYIAHFLVGFGFIGLTACGNANTQEESEIQIPVSVEMVKSGQITEYISTTGTVKPFKDVSLVNELKGKYNLLKNPNTGRTFALGDVVKAGTPIIKIEDKEYENQIKIQSVQLQLETTKRDYDKQASLYEKGGVTLTELKTAERSYIDAKYDAENAEIQLSKMTIKAPFTGVIVKLPHYTKGVEIEASQEMLSMMEYANMYMEASLPEKEIGNISVNQKVMVTHYSMEEDTVYGKVSAISPSIDEETRTFTAQILIENPQRKFRPGMFVEAGIEVASKDSTIVIPKDVVLATQKGKTVYVVEKSLAKQRILKTGLENNDEIEVLNGLAKGDRLVIDGYEVLGNKTKVKVLKSKK